MLRSCNNKHHNITAQMNTTKTIPNILHIEEGVSWIGGPTHVLQRQHIPGYGGHIPSIVSENVHGKGFSRISAECLNQRNSTGFKPDVDEMYKTNYDQQFQRPDIRKTNLSFTASKILTDLERKEVQINRSNYQGFVNQPKSINEIKPIDRTKVVGYMGHRPVFRHPLRTVKAPSEPKPVRISDIDQLHNMINTGNFDSKKLSNMVNKNVPVVGYSGFLKNVKAQNMFGETYKDLAKKSIYS